MFHINRFAIVVHSRRVTHSDEKPAPIFAKLPDTDDERLKRKFFESSSTSDEEEEDVVHDEWDADRVSLCSQSELNDLIPV